MAIQMYWLSQDYDTGFMTIQVRLTMLFTMLTWGWSSQLTPHWLAPSHCSPPVFISNLLNFLNLNLISMKNLSFFMSNAWFLNLFATFKTKCWSPPLRAMLVFLKTCLQLSKHNCCLTGIHLNKLLQDPPTQLFLWWVQVTVGEKFLAYW